MSDTDHIPKAGEPLKMADIEMIFEAVAKRQQNFPDEPAAMTFAVILLNIGDRFAPVTCVELEWEGLKSDIPPGEDLPKCPNGHALIQETGLSLGWVPGV